jgi:hypothetical protein
MPLVRMMGWHAAMEEQSLRVLGAKLISGVDALHDAIAATAVHR